MLVTQTTKNAFFFEKFYRGHDPPHPQSCLYTPPVETPAPAHPDRLHSTGSRAGRARTRADKYQGIPPPKRWTRCTGLHSIPDRPRRADRNGGGVLGVSETVQIWTTQFYHFVPEKQIRKILYFVQKVLTYKIYLI